jgi:hypothetical protein
MTIVALKRPSTDLPPTAVEDLIVTLHKARRLAAAIGLPRVVTSIEYAYLEALGALREKPRSPEAQQKLLVVNDCRSSTVEPASDAAEILT